MMIRPLPARLLTPVGEVSQLGSLGGLCLLCVQRNRSMARQHVQWEHRRRERSFDILARPHGIISFDRQYPCSSLSTTIRPLQSCFRNNVAHFSGGRSGSTWVLGGPMRSVSTNEVGGKGARLMRMAVIARIAEICRT